MKPLLLILFSLCAMQLRADVLPRQESESQWVTDHIRSYYTTTENGEKRLVITNLDQSGKRIGPPVKIENEKRKTTFARSYASRQIPPQFYAEPNDQDLYAADQLYRYDPYVRRGPYFNPYDSPGWIPDYPGSAFGFHLFPQFPIIHPQRISAFRAYQFRPWRRFR